ncbi:MAG: nucleoside-diphosphate sugar epimerase/dehydratase, partial [Acidobacteriota bacterium]
MASGTGVVKVATASRTRQSKARAWWIGFLSRRTQYGLDLAILALAFVVSYLFRFDFAMTEDQMIRGLTQLPFVVLIQFTVLTLAGVHSFIWRYIGMAEVRSFVNATIWSLLPLIAFRLSLPDRLQGLKVPLSIILMDTLLAFGGIVGLRVLRRALYEQYERQRESVRANGRKKPVLLIGAGRAGVLAAKEILGRGDMGLEVKGFIDDDHRKQGLTIQGVRVCGGTSELPRLVREFSIDHVIITIASASRNKIRRIIETCEQIPVRVRIIPGLYEILEGHVEVSRIRDVQIEDLLGREAVQLDEESMREFLAGKTVMVTGAGGSIGSELARQAARFLPEKLLLVERAEFALFNIDRELRESNPDLSITPFVVDVGDERGMETVFSQYRPQVVLHAAAHKHVPMMENNAPEAVKNNILATRALGEMAGRFGSEAFVLISTDKAVRPQSIMGATKRVAELVVQALNQRYETRYVAVRFGNVIGSAGSVIPIFQDQIRRGGPVTVTHPEMVRYFMTIPEAAQLVLQAGTMGEGGEIFILDMGEPVRILDIARDLITLSGLKPYEDIDIAFTGIRPGEKLFEELAINEEGMTKTRHPKIFIGRIAAYPERKVRLMVERLSSLATAGEERQLRRTLNACLPEARIA